MRFNTLPEWLSWQENLHFTEVDPGLARIGQVWSRLNDGTNTLPFTVITVAGTNGKGSSVAMLEAILQQAGYITGTYTSPHLLSYNERICVNNTPCDDEQICASFNRIDSARQDVSLTYFEFATLAAIDIFIEQSIDVAILEVGMGGRLDAVNLFDADIALITPIGLDHITWLGDNREKIGFEKAGIIRSGKPVVSSEQAPPLSIIEHAEKLGAQFYQADKDYSICVNETDWSWQSESTTISHLAFPSLAGHYQLSNAAAVLKVIELLTQKGINIPKSAIDSGLSNIRLAGRFQQIPGSVERILDVTHNQQGAENLVRLLTEKAVEGKTFAVMAMLKDKDVTTVVEILKDSIDKWFLAGLEGVRGLSVEEMTDQLKAILSEQQYISNQTVEQAYHAAMQQAESGDRILIFGSFHTVEAAMNIINSEQ